MSKWLYSLSNTKPINSSVSCSFKLINSRLTDSSSILFFGLNKLILVNNFLKTYGNKL